MDVYSYESRKEWMNDWNEQDIRQMRSSVSPKQRKSITKASFTICWLARNYRGSAAFAFVVESAHLSFGLGVELLAASSLSTSRRTDGSGGAPCDEVVAFAARFKWELSLTFLAGPALPRAAASSSLLRCFCCSMARSRSSGVDRLLLSSGGGGMAIQLYWRFSTGRPQRSYSSDCERSDSKQSRHTTTNWPFSIDRLWRGWRCCFRNGKSWTKHGSPTNISSLRWLFLLLSQPFQVTHFQWLVRLNRICIQWKDNLGYPLNYNPLIHSLHAAEFIKLKMTWASPLQGANEIHILVSLIMNAILSVDCWSQIKMYFFSARVTVDLCLAHISTQLEGFEEVLWIGAKYDEIRTNPKLYSTIYKSCKIEQLKKIPLIVYEDNKIYYQQNLNHLVKRIRTTSERDWGNRAKNFNDCSRVRIESRNTKEN